MLMGFTPFFLRDPAQNIPSMSDCPAQKIDNRKGPKQRIYSFLAEPPAVLNETHHYQSFFSQHMIFITVTLLDKVNENIPLSEGTSPNCSVIEMAYISGCC